MEQQTGTGRGGDGAKAGTTPAGPGLPVNVFEYEDAARPNLDPHDYDSIAGGATDEITLQHTRRAFDSLSLRPRVLQDVSGLDLSTTVLGTRLGFPVMTAPAGGHKKAHPDGELATARAVAAMGGLMAISAHSSYTLEEIAQASSAPLWYQMYLFKDRELTISWVRRAEAAGCKAICITADAFWPPKRERVIRNRSHDWSLGLGANYQGVSRQEMENDTQRVVIPTTGRAMVNPAATWKDIVWLKEQTALPVVVKGVMTGEDAALAAEHGVDGIVVSNHGGRNVDTTIPTIEALPEVVEAAKGRLEVYLDGGIRRGTDILKALALGARAVLIGRPVFWGLAAGGEAGLTRLLAILREELESSMAICGKPTIASLDPRLVVRSPSAWRGAS